MEQFFYESKWSGTHPNWPKFLSTQGVACRWAGRVCDATIGTNSSIQRNSQKKRQPEHFSTWKKERSKCKLVPFPTYTHPKQHIQSAGSKWMHLFEFNDRGELNHERFANCLGHFLSVIAPKRQQRHLGRLPAWNRGLIWFDLSWLDNSVSNFDGDWLAKRWIVIGRFAELIACPVLNLCVEGRALGQKCNMIEGSLEV